MESIIDAIDREMYEAEARIIELRKLRETAVSLLSAPLGPSAVLPASKSAGRKLVSGSASKSTTRRRHVPKSKLRLPYKNYVACVLAEYPDDEWTSSDLLETIGDDMPNPPAVHNAVRNAAGIGLVAIPSRGVYKATKAGVRELKRALRAGVYDPKVERSSATEAPAVPDKRMNTRGKSSAAGKKTQLAKENAEPKKPGPQPKSPTKKPGTKARSPRGTTLTKESDTAAPKKSSLDLLVQPSAQGRKRSLPATPVVNTVSDVNQLRALMATRPDEVWEFKELVQTAGIDPKRLALALKEAIGLNGVTQVAQGKYQYENSDPN